MPADEPKEFPYTWLRFWREEAGLTAAELGEEVDKTKVSISHFERGKKRPSSATAGALAEAISEHLDDPVTVDDLFPPVGVYEPKKLMRLYVRKLRRDG